MQTKLGSLILNGNHKNCTKKRQNSLKWEWCYWASLWKASAESLETWSQFKILGFFSLELRFSAIWEINFNMNYRSAEKIQQSLNSVQSWEQCRNSWFKIHPSNHFLLTKMHEHKKTREKWFTGKFQIYKFILTL